MLKTSISSLCLVATLAGLASGQERPVSSGFPPLQHGMLGLGVVPGPVPTLVLIRVGAVQDELKLNQDQKDRIDALEQSQRRAKDELLQTYRRNLPRLEPGERPDPQVMQALQGPLRAALDQIGAETETAVRNVLAPEQRRRFDGIQLQAEGPLAFTRPEIHRQLNMSPNQIEEIGGIIAEGQEAMYQASAVRVPSEFQNQPYTPDRGRQLFESKTFQKELEGRREATLKVREVVLQKIFKCLSKKQRAKYLAILGEPFDMAKLRGDGPATIAPGKTGGSAGKRAAPRADPK